MTEQAARPRSIATLLQSEPIVEALRDAGATDETLEAIHRFPSVALAAVMAASNANSLIPVNDADAARRRAVLARALTCTQLPAYFMLALRAIGIETLGDLALTTESELRNLPDIGEGSVLSAHNTLSTYNLRLREKSQDAMQYAMYLYGGIEHVPSHLLSHLIGVELDTFTYDYLSKVGSLGQLAQTSAVDFLQWRCNNSGERELDKPQLARLVVALQTLGLSLRP